jgi:sugar lactone lactonase YvrE
LIVSMHQRSVLRLEYDTLVVHGDLSHIATFHCNDMVVDAFGRAYVGNFGFDLDGAITGGNFAAELAAYEGASVARIDPNGMIHCVATHLLFPNGMVVTSDGGTMIVAETLGRRLTAFDIGIDGSLTNQRVWAELDRAAPDGICLDQTGGVWVADASASRCIRVVEGGTITDVVETSQPCYACMLGGPDGRTLFMLTCESSLPEIAGSRRTARIEVTTVDVGHAGLP